ncbi:uncharacterized protein LOC111392434 [Olea europaea var. sylvestris]|uniref:uncharacterized protein LOC111392434 n=1 Tax=Olea europaea var. sylvestris TaxID=158386 RepID=UPI000C1D6976|nr:uncharacterized protein LOC111392434 [Olea europaea var. sylvestris]
MVLELRLMGCFLGCFGGSKNSKRRTQMVNRGSPRDQVRHFSYFKFCFSPKFESYVLLFPPIFMQHRVSLSLSENNCSVASNVRLYPPNHRYHNIIDGNDESQEYGDIDLDDLDVMDDQDDSDYDHGIACKEVWSESVLTASMKSRTEDTSARTINEEVERPLIRIALPKRIMEAFGQKINAGMEVTVNSVLNPVENTTQWKAVRLKGMQPLKPQKENLIADLEAPHISFSRLEPNFKQSSHILKPKLDHSNNANKESDIDSSLSSWLVSPDITPTKKNITRFDFNEEL